jgi:heme A synthase
MFFALAMIVAAITRREWFHRLLAPAAGLSFLLYITLLYARL